MYDKNFNRTLADEAGQMPLVFRMNSCKFRWDVFKMAYEMTNPKSLDRVIITAEQIIEWVNNEVKLPSPPTPK